MNLAKINLNLLVALDALLEERHVTRAAQKVFITQSAMSIALGQLRELLQDEILVRSAQGMIPTQRAIELQPQVQRLLHEIKALVHPPSVFDPATAKRTFRIGMNDYTEFLVLPRLLTKIAKIAPNISLQVVNLNMLDQHELFTTERLDLAVGMFFEKNTPLATEFLFRESGVCVARKSHPLIQKPLTLKRFLQAKHIAINLCPVPTLSRIDRALRKLGVERDVALGLPHMIAAFYLVRHTDHLLVSMRGMAEELIKPFNLAMQELPFVSESVDIFMAWPKLYTTDSAHTWLRTLLHESVFSKGETSKTA